MSLKPLKGKLQVGSAYYENVKNVQVNFNINEEVDYVTFTVKEPVGQQINLNDEIVLYYDTEDGTTKKFTGQIISKRIQPVTADYREYVFEALDYTKIFSNRFVAEAYFNKEASEIIKDIIDKYCSEVTYNNVQSTSLTLPEYVIPYRKITDVINDLAKIVNYVWWVDKNKDLHFKPKTSGSPEFTLGKNEVLDVVKYEVSLHGVKNKIYVIGGKIQKVDQSAETEYSSETVESEFKAVKFKPTQPNLSQIAVKVEKVGSPEDALVVEIREDLDGQPKGATLKAINYPPTYVGAKDFYKAVVDVEVDTERYYWIVLRKVGDASNTYRWYRDNETSGTHAVSSDGVTWTVTNNSWRFLFQTYYGTPVIAEASDTPSITQYGLREDVYQDHSIVSFETAQQVAEGLVKKLKSPLELVRLKVTTDHDYYVGQVVALDYPGLTSGNFVVTKVIAPLKPGKESHSLEIVLVSQSGSPSPGSLESLVAEILSDIRREKVRQAGVMAATVVDTIKSLSDSFSLSESLTATMQDSGTFKVGSAKVGFATCG